MQMQMENNNNNNNRKFDRDDVVVIRISLCVWLSFLFVAMTIFGWARWVSISLCDDILIRHYSQEEIVKNNLIIKSIGRNGTTVSNGDILSHDEYLIFFSRMWRRTVPCFLMWILFFLFLLFAWLINRVATKFLDDKMMIMCQRNTFINGYNHNYNKAITCILNKINMPNSDQDVYNRLIVELIGNINKKILESGSASILLDSLSFEDWYDAIIPESLKQNETVDCYTQATLNFMGMNTQS
jgi:hypothetical protein